MAHLGHGVRGAVLTADAALSATVTNDPDPEHAQLSESSGSAPPEPSAAGPLARTRAAAKRHWPFLVVLVLGLMLRVVTQVAYRPSLLYIDSYRYLELVRTTNPETSQPLGYVFFLWPVLKLGNLFVVVVLQHAMGLGIGVAIYVLCMRYGVSRWIAAAATIPILLDAYQLQIEQNVMSETLFEALLVGGMLALLWNRRPSTRALVIGGVLLGASVPVRIVALPAIVPAVIFAFVCGPGGWRRLGRAAIVGLAFLVPVVGYMGFYKSEAGHWGLTTSDAHALYGRAAQIVDCNELSYPSYEELLCPKVPLSQRVGVDYYAHTYPSGELVTPPPGQTFRDVLRDFTQRVFRSQPLDLAHAVAIDFLKGFRWDRTDARGDVVVKRWQFQTYFPNLGQDDPLAATKRWGGGPPTVVKPLASFLRRYQLSVGYTPGPFLFLAFLCGVLGGCGAFRARWSHLRAVLWLPTLTGLAVLLAADFFEFSWRYQLPALVLAPIAGALGITAMFRDPQAVYPAATRPESMPHRSVRDRTVDATPAASTSRRSGAGP